MLLTIATTEAVIWLKSMNAFLIVDLIGTACSRISTMRGAVKVLPFNRSYHSGFLRADYTLLRSKATGCQRRSCKAQAQVDRAATFDTLQLPVVWQISQGA